MSDQVPPRKPAQTIRVADIARAASAESERAAWLTVIRGGRDLGAQVRVEDGATLGRDPACDLTLQDLGVSWRHARVAHEGAHYRIEDLGSTNGTHVAGEAVEGARELRDGDKIFLGESTVVRFTLADAVDVAFLSEIDQLVNTDELTGLESKRRFDEAFEFALQVAVREETSVAMLMMDMDGVKQINDTHGHPFGAYVIGETGRLIGRHVRPEGHASRFGGDEFMAFLPGVGKTAACEAAEQIRQAVETAGFEKDGIALKPTISIGVACFPHDAGDVRHLLEAADAALYRAKGQGKNRVCT